MGHVATVTIDHTKVPADLTDFPAFIDLSDLPSEFWDTVANGGGDIRIYASDGTTQWPREIEDCDTATDTGRLHTKIPFLSSSVDTDVQIWTDEGTEPASDSTYGSEAVWSDYVGVWHLNESFPATAVDATGNGYDMDQDQGSPGDSTSLLGKGMAVGSNEHIYRDFIAELNGISSFTVSGWLKLTGTFNNERAIFGNRTTSGSPDRGFTLYADYSFGGNSNTVVLANGGASSAVAPSNSIVVNQEHLIHGTYEGGSATGQKIYVDGVLQASADASGLSSTLSNNSQTSIGGLRTNARDVVPADLDEVRITTALRSDVWVSVENANQSSPSTFYTATAAGGGTTVEAALSSNLSAGYTPSNQAQIEAGSSGSLSMAVATDGSAQAEVALSFALSVSDAVAALAVGEAAFTVSQTLSDSAVGQTQAGGEIEGIVSFSTQLAGVATADAAALATIASGIEAAGSMTAIVAIPSALSAGVQAGTSTTAFVGIGSNISAGILAGAQATGEAQAYAAISVDQSFGATLIAEAMAEAGLSVSSVQNVSFVGVSISGDAVTPDGRRFRVSLDLRTFEVSLETRSFKANQE